MKKLLIYYNFIIISVVVVFGFFGAQTYTQLVPAVLFFPLFAYFFSKVIPKRNKTVDLTDLTKFNPDTGLNFNTTEETGKVDKDRRAFLKLIGTAGLSLFMFTLFTKKTEAAFFGSVPGPGTVSIKDSSGNKIDPAEKKPTDGYNITDLDDSSPSYYGYVNKSGAWFIMKEDSSGAYRYIKGASSYSTNWTNRAGLSYDYFDNIF